MRAPFILINLDHILYFNIDRLIWQCYLSSIFNQTIPPTDIECCILLLELCKFDYKYLTPSANEYKFLNIVFC